MAMTADLARPLTLDFAPIPQNATARLREILSDRVTIANPFDFHTYIWFDRDALRAMFTAVLRCGFDAVGFVLDCPPEGKADTSAFTAALTSSSPHRSARQRALHSLHLTGDLVSHSARALLAAGVVPLQDRRGARGLESCRYCRRNVGLNARAKAAHSRHQDRC